MFNYHIELPKKDIGGGIIFQDLGKGDHMNVWYWNMEDGSVVKLHQHESEQFGYIIKGGFKLTIGNETKTLKTGDSYFIPSNIPHSFVTIGETEAIDVFSPVRPYEDTPGRMRI